MTIEAALYEFSDDRTAIVMAAYERLDEAMSSIRRAIDPPSLPDLLANYGQQSALGSYFGYANCQCQNTPQYAGIDGLLGAQGLGSVFGL